MKKILAALLLAALLLAMLPGCSQEWREIPSPDRSETVVLGQLDRYEIDDTDNEWGVVSIDQPPYSVDFLANEEINSNTTRPGTWLYLSLDGNIAYDIRLVGFE